MPKSTFCVRAIHYTVLYSVPVHNGTVYYSLYSSVADPYHFDTDPDPDCEKILYGSGSMVNFDTDPDPGKNDTDPGSGSNKKGLSTRKIFKK